MAEENEEVLTTTTSEGDTSFMVCRTTDENKRQKVCMEVEKENPSTSKSASEGMLDNNTYNLMEQLLVENRSLWRIKNNYKSDSTMDDESKRLWDFIEKDKEEIVKLISERLMERL